MRKSRRSRSRRRGFRCEGNARAICRRNWSCRSTRSSPAIAADERPAARRALPRIGKAEGWRANRLSSREDFVALIDGSERMLEIGPFSKPLRSGDGVRYADFLDQPGLQQRARDIGFNPDTVPFIHYVLSLVGDQQEIAAAPVPDQMLHAGVVHDQVGLVNGRPPPAATSTCIAGTSRRTLSRRTWRC